MASAPVTDLFATPIAKKLQVLYEQEQSEARVPLEASDLPLSYEAFNSQWLTNVLCADTPGAKVVSFELGAPDEGSSNRRSLIVQYNAAGESAGLPKKLFCKSWHRFSNRVVNAITGTLSAEMTFYQKVRDNLNIEAPRHRFAAIDKETFNGIIILTDISDSIEFFCTHDTPMNRSRAESQLELLSKVHGRYYQHPELDRGLAGLGTWPEFFGRTRILGMEESSNAGFLAAEAVVPPRLYKEYDRIWPATLRSADKHNELPRTVIHSDVHLRNWYLVSGDKMGLSDWGCCTQGHWSRDLAYVIATACTIDDRRAWERDLIAYYLDRLASEGGARVSFDEGWDHYRQQMFSALAFWTHTYTPTPGMPDMQPGDASLEFVRRIATAVDDLDSLAVCER